MRKLGRYVLLSRIASGTLGDAFLARKDTESPGDEAGYAIKLIRPELARDLRFTRLLFAEAPAAVRFDHPAAVRTLEIDRDGGEVFIAMPLVRGQPLSSVLKRAQLANEPLEHRLACAIGADLASVLARAHETPWFQGAPVGMVHGGISPRAVIVTYEGHTKLLGMGIGRARLAAPLSSARLAYCAPEIVAEKEPTARSDVYALGMLLHDALSGKHVLRRATDEETKAAIKEARIPPLNPLSLRVNPAIGEMIQRMTVPKAEARFADLREIERALREAGGDDPRALLEKRMRAIFVGEMRAERRVVLAAGRQRGTSGAAVPASGTSPPIAKPHVDPIAQAAMSMTGGVSEPSVRAHEDPANAVTLSDAPLGKAVRPLGELLGLTSDSKSAASSVEIGPNDTDPGMTPGAAAALASAVLEEVERRQADVELAKREAELARQIAAKREAELAKQEAERSDREGLPKWEPPMVAHVPAEGTPWADVPKLEVKPPFAGAESERTDRANEAPAARGPSPDGRRYGEENRPLPAPTPNDTLPLPREAPLGSGFDESAFAPTSPRTPLVANAPVGPAFAHLLEPAARELVRRASSTKGTAQPESIESFAESLPTDEVEKPNVDESTAEAAELQPAPKRGDGTTTVDFAAQRRVARYQTEVVISRSASTVVYRARDPNVSRSVALKLMDPDFVSDPRLRREEWVTLFKREARLAGRLTHPLIPTLYDAGRDGNVYFLVYAMIEGEPLSSILERGEMLRPDRIKSILADVAGALDHMHERGTIHCDVRAGNVMIGKDNRAHLVDFSMTSDVEGPEHPLLAANLLVLSPEYLSGYGYTARSDQFALGMLLYQLLTGVRPFRGADDRELIRAIEEKSPRPPQAIDPGVDAELSEIAMRLLEKDPALRFDRCASIARRVETTSADRRLPGNVPDMDSEGPDTHRSLVPLTRDHEMDGLAPDIAIIDPQLDPALAKKVLAARDEHAEVYAELERALMEIESGPPRVVVVAKTATIDTRTVRRRVAEVSRDIEVRVVPELASRLVGPVLSPDELAFALTAMYERAGTLAQPVDPSPDRGPVGAARAMARRLGAGPRAEVLAPLAVAARALAERLRLSPTSEEIASIVPPEVGMLFAEIERQSTDGGPRASLLAEIAIAVESYYSATSPKDGRQRVSPRRAILELRELAGKRFRVEVIDALIDHLRETISALELGPAEADALRLLLAGISGDAPIARALALDGFAVEVADNGETAWKRLESERFLGAIVDQGLPGRDGASLLERARAHPETANVPFLIVAPAGDAELAHRVARAGGAELVDSTAALEGVRAKIGRWMKRRTSAPRSNA